ncbi:MAG: GDP-mannose 4,6-dehydratase [Firmicutes bacterium]|nr:GDP-mannose 4,6-dehydratase [Bacillota bacterium]
MKKVLITGAAGFIGCHLAEHFRREGYIVIGIDISTPAKARDYIFYNIDVQTSQVGDIIKKHRPDACIHCAGPASVADSLAFPENDFKLTVLPTHNLLNAIKNGYPECKFVYLSSAAVYGDPSHLPVSETHPAVPISPYGFHKMQAENICREFFSLYNLPVSVARIFSAYGCGLKKQILWDLCLKAKRGGAVELFGTGEETRDFINAVDLGQAVRLIIEESPFTLDFYNVANGQQIKIRDLARMLLEEFPGVSGLSFNGQCRPGDPLYWVADISRLETLGYKQCIDLKEGVYSYVKWFRQLG